jgi:hypothetical protein
MSFLKAFSTFLGVSRQGEFKNAIKMFLQKSPCRKLFHLPRKSTKISVSVFPRLFVFYRVFRCFSAMGVQKNRVEKFLQKIDKKSKTDFSSFWAFLGEGS